MNSVAAELQFLFYVNGPKPWIFTGHSNIQSQSVLWTPKFCRNVKSGIKDLFFFHYRMLLVNFNLFHFR